VFLFWRNLGREWSRHVDNRCMGCVIILWMDGLEWSGFSYFHMLLLSLLQGGPEEKVMRAEVNNIPNNIFPINLISFSPLVPSQFSHTAPTTTTTSKSTEIGNILPHFPLNHSKILPCNQLFPPHTANLSCAMFNLIGIGKMKNGWSMSMT
jgi:hypothetical protein